MLEGKRILIFGGGGFIGKNLYKHLQLNSDCNVDIVTHNDCDITDADAVLEMVKLMRPHIIFNLAGIVDRKMIHIHKSMDVNFIGTFNILEAVRKVGFIKTVVMMGSSDEYGTNTVPFNEEQEEKPQSSYAISKSCATNLCRFYSDMVSTNIIVLRPSLVYGPFQDNNMLIPSMMHSYFKNKEFETSSGAQVRDFIYITDLIEAMARVCSLEKWKDVVLNIGSGKPRKVSDVIDIMHNLTPYFKVKKGAIDIRKGELDNHYPNVILSKTLLDWEAKVSLEEGIKKTLEFWKDIYRRGDINVK